MTVEGEYGKSEHGNFEVVDTMGVPHPYCIGPRHIAHAADHFGGMLGKVAIESGEKRGITCCMKGCNLKYSEHEQALVVACYESMAGPDKKAVPELHQYLLRIKDEATKNGYAGFAFLDRRKNRPE